MSGGVRLQQWHILKCQILGNLKCHYYCETNCVSDTLTWWFDTEKMPLMNICMLEIVMVTMSFHVLEHQRSLNQEARTTSMEKPVKR